MESGGGASVRLTILPFEAGIIGCFAGVCEGFTVIKTVAPSAPVAEMASKGIALSQDFIVPRTEYMLQLPPQLR